MKLLEYTRPLEFAGTNIIYIASYTTCLITDSYHRYLLVSSRAIVWILLELKLDKILALPAVTAYLSERELLQEVFAFVRLPKNEIGG